MNILINCPSLKKIDNKLGGIESLNLALAKKLTKKKFNVTISTNCKKSSITDKIKNLNINVLIKDPNKFNFDTKDVEQIDYTIGRPVKLEKTITLSK